MCILIDILYTGSWGHLTPSNCTSHYTSHCTSHITSHCTSHCTSPFQNRPGAYAHEAIDAATYCEWGLDYLKNDNCGGTNWKEQNTSWINFQKGFDECYNKTGRYIVKSIEYCRDPDECGQWIGGGANLVSLYTNWCNYHSIFSVVNYIDTDTNFFTVPLRPDTRHCTSHCTHTAFYIRTCI